MAVTAVPRADGEICAASVVDPNASVIKAPSLSEDAGRFAALANQADTTVCIDAAAAEVEVIGRTIEGPYSTVASAIGVFPYANGEVRAASAVDPDAVPSHAPGPAVDARGLAPLTHELDAARAVDRAEMTIEIVRRAV